MTRNPLLKQRAEYIEIGEEKPEDGASSEVEACCQRCCQHVPRVLAVMLIIPLFLVFLALTIIIGVVTLPLMCIFPCCFPCIVALQKVFTWLTQESFRLLRQVCCGYATVADDKHAREADDSGVDDVDSEEETELKDSFLRTSSYGTT